MNSHQVTKLAFLTVTFPQVSPTFHPLRVKREIAGKGLYIKENNNSLFIFHPFTPTHPRDARPRVCACVREGGGKGET